MFTSGKNLGVTWKKHSVKTQGRPKETRFEKEDDWGATSPAQLSQTHNIIINNRKGTTQAEGGNFWLHVGGLMIRASEGGRMESLPQFQGSGSFDIDDSWNGPKEVSEEKIGSGYRNNMGIE